MITKEQVTKLVEEATKDTDVYLVDLKIASDNRITVYLDNSTRITIDECSKVSKFIDEHLDRDREDFELTVSSPGLDEPLKHIKQFHKRMGCQLGVVLKDGKKEVGKLVGVNEDGIVLEQKSKEQVGTKKSRQTVIHNNDLMFDQIKEAKLVLTF